jgi:predicted ester cyclase
VRGRDGFIAYAQAVRAAFPDFHNEVRELLIDQGRAAACLEYSGTHRGPILAVAPTDRRITYRGAAFFWFDEQARIARGWVLGDLVNLLKQLDPTQWAQLPETRS